MMGASKEDKLMENILETNALTKRYGGVTVVNGVSLAVPQGSVYGFIGPNGEPILMGKQYYVGSRYVIVL